MRVEAEGGVVVSVVAVVAVVLVVAVVVVVSVVAVVVPPRVLWIPQHHRCRGGA